MRVTRKLEIYMSSAHHVRIIGLVDQNNCRFATRNILERLVEIIVFLEYIIDSRKPNACALPFKRHRYIPQHAHTVTLQCGGDEVWISHDIVIA